MGGVLSGDILYIWGAQHGPQTVGNIYCAEGHGRFYFRKEKHQELGRRRLKPGSLPFRTKEKSLDKRK